MAKMIRKLVKHHSCKSRMPSSSENEYRGIFSFHRVQEKHVLKKVIWCFLLNFPRCLSITVSVYFQNRFLEKWCVITFILRVFEGYCFQKWMLFCRSKQIEQRYAYDKNILKKFTSNRHIMWYPKKKTDFDMSTPNKSKFYFLLT